MTAKTQSKKRRRQRRRAGPGREPNGRLSRRLSALAARRAESEAEITAVALSARMRHTGLPAALAGAADAGTVHGRLRLCGEITADQFRAAEFFLGVRLAYQRALQVPDRPRQPSEGRGLGDDAEFAKAAIARYDAVMACLRDAGAAQRSPVVAAFDILLFRQQELPHLYGDLRLGLNALHRAFLARR